MVISKILLPVEYMLHAFVTLIRQRYILLAIAPLRNSFYLFNFQRIKFNKRLCLTYSRYLPKFTPIFSLNRDCSV
jgi:hypothetical protein